MKAIIGSIIIVAIIASIFGAQAFFTIMALLGVGLLYFFFQNNKKEDIKVNKNMLGGVLKEHPKEEPIIEYKSQSDQLFKTEITQEGTDFFFNSHPAMMASEFVIIDFETANTRARSAVSLGITHFNKGNCVTKEFIFKPYQTKDFKFSYLHGITADTVKDKPGFEFYWPEIKTILDGKTIFAHNTEFDISVLQTLIKDLELEDLDYNFKVFCTLEYARSKKLNSKYGITNSLESLCRFYKINYGKHNGAKDTISTLFLLNQLLYENHIETDSAIKKLKGKKYNTLPINIASEIKELSHLYKSGVLTEEEFIAGKTKLLK